MSYTDPGGMDPGPPKSAPAYSKWHGSEKWAHRWRLELAAIISRLEDEPKRLALSVQEGLEFSAVGLINREDGSKFSSFREFCEDPQPYGLGIPWRKINDYLSALLGRKQADALLSTQPVVVTDRQSSERVIALCQLIASFSEDEKKAVVDKLRGSFDEHANLAAPHREPKRADRSLMKLETPSVRIPGSKRRGVGGKSRVFEVVCELNRPVTAVDVANAIDDRPDRPTGLLNSVSNTLRNLVEAGLLVREKGDRSYVYSPVEAEG